MQYNLNYILAICLLTLFSLPLSALEKEEDSHKLLTKIEAKTGLSTHNNEILALLYRQAYQWLKIPYRYGGTSPKGVDCSALTGKIYENAFGIQLKRSSRDIARDVETIDKENLKPGDLVFFATHRRSEINHVGIYLGNQHFVHASRTNGVIISNLNESYYKRTWAKGGRLKNNQQETYRQLLAARFQYAPVPQIDLKPQLLEKTETLLDLSRITSSIDRIQSF